VNTFQGVNMSSFRRSGPLFSSNGLETADIIGQDRSCSHFPTIKPTVKPRIRTIWALDAFGIPPLTSTDFRKAAQFWKLAIALNAN
jgi:hypothetical protein